MLHAGFAGMCAAFDRGNDQSVGRAMSVLSGLLSSRPEPRAIDPAGAHRPGTPATPHPLAAGHPLGPVARGPLGRPFPPGTPPGAPGIRAVDHRTAEPFRRLPSPGVRSAASGPRPTGAFAAPPAGHAAHGAPGVRR